MFDNLYYVGPGYVSVWLLTTPDGNILFASVPSARRVLDPSVARQVVSQLCGADLGEALTEDERV